MFALNRRTALALGLGAAGVAALPPLARAVALGAPVGRVGQLRGTVEARAGDSVRGRAVSEGGAVAFGDRLLTGRDARARIDLEDGTSFSLGADAEFVIDNFVYDPVNSLGEAGFTLLTGAFRMATGLATNAGGPAGRTAFTVNTPVAVIGIRGTDFWGLQSAERLDLALLEGGPVTLSTAAGVTTLRDAPFVSVVEGPGAAPTPPRRLSDQELAAAAATVAF